MVSDAGALYCYGPDECRYCSRCSCGSAVNRYHAGTSWLAVGFLPGGRRRPGLDALVDPRVLSAAKHPHLSTDERRELVEVLAPKVESGAKVRWIDLFRYPQVSGLVVAKFLSDAAWYFYIFWLPKYLYDVHHFDTKQVGYFAWIPYAAAGLAACSGLVLEPVDPAGLLS